MPFASTASASPNDTVTIGFTLEPVSLDITGVAGAAIPQVLLNNVYEGLLKVQPDGKIVPSLARTYSVSKNGLTYTFQLNKAKFHDGSAVTARDVAWSLNRVIDPNSSVLPAQKQQFSSVASVTARGPSTVVITLKARDNDFEFNLTQRGGVVFKTGATDFATKTNGTGPYKLKNWNRGSSITLERNENYYKPKAKTKTVVFRYILDATALSNAILSGQIDIMSTVQAPELLAAFRGRKNLKVYSGTTAGEVTLSMNNSKAPFNNPKVRQAIRQAINKKALIKTAWAGYGLQIGSFVPPTDPWYENLASKYPFDLKKSRQLLTEAGYPNGFDMTLDVPPAPYALASQEFIAASLAQVGIRVTLRPVAWAEWLDRVFAKANYDMSIVAHVERNDMAIYANPNYYFRFNNAQYQALIKQASEARTQTLRTNALRKAARILNDQHASDWLWLLPNLQVAKANVSGFQLNVVGDAYTVADIVKK
jgi:peptide/nickel transport system substrate-binding protein